MSLRVSYADVDDSRPDAVVGAVVASPTFSLPEFIGGTRNWCVSAIQLARLCFPTTKIAYRDYRASWIRDSSFTLYALIRLGFTHEADGTIIIHLSGAGPYPTLPSLHGVHL